MIKIEASPGRNIQLGYAGEDKVTKVIFPYDEEWLDLGAGNFYIRVLRPGDIEPYDAHLLDFPPASYRRRSFLTTCNQPGQFGLAFNVPKA